MHALYCRCIGKARWQDEVAAVMSLRILESWGVLESCAAECLGKKQRSLSVAAMKTVQMDTLRVSVVQDASVWL